MQAQASNDYESYDIVSLQYSPEAEPLHSNSAWYMLMHLSIFTFTVCLVLFLLSIAWYSIEEVSWRGLQRLQKKLIRDRVGSISLGVSIHFYISF